VRISFPGAATLNTVQQIRRDGNITLPLVGEFKAAGLAPSQAEKELVKLYEPHLQVKEVNVVVESSNFAVYVTGAVLRPGKIMSDRPITAMEAVVEAGIDHNKANLKKVRLIRQEKGRSEYHILNLKETLKGKPAESFDLKPGDIIYVPERFSFF
jgi:polysaccharide export outer membrane protein